MKISVVKDYQAWANRGYLTAYVCLDHPALNLIPLWVDDAILMVCPLQDYKKELGLVEYLTIERKAAMAAILHEKKGR